MGDVTYFNGVTRLPLPAAQILDQAKAANLDLAIVIGYDAEGREYFASSEPDGADVLWLLERCKKALLETVDEEED
ncbi:hypothetical protein [Alloalcanivorax xenomutans]|uniref:hypothetical protein n=1 Tax=Alloalcanivorax xenomutans TaxID=1094342 RepID=UPI00047B6154